MFIILDSDDNALKCISCDFALYYRYIKVIRKEIANYDKLERNYTYR